MSGHQVVKFFSPQDCDSSIASYPLTRRDRIQAVYRFCTGDVVFVYVVQSVQVKIKQPVFLKEDDIRCSVIEDRIEVNVSGVLTSDVGGGDSFCVVREES